jgi:COP9 signalosome complex subunit 4
MAFGRHFVSSSSVAMVVGRRVLGDFVSALCGGSELAKKQSGDDEEQKWAVTGKGVFDTEEGKIIRQEVVEGVLTPGGLAGWCEEQVRKRREKGKWLMR